MIPKAFGTKFQLEKFKSWNLLFEIYQLVASFVETSAVGTGTNFFLRLKISPNLLKSLRYVKLVPYFLDLPTLVALPVNKSTFSL